MEMDFKNEIFLKPIRNPELPEIPVVIKNAKTVHDQLFEIPIDKQSGHIFRCYGTKNDFQRTSFSDSLFRELLIFNGFLKICSKEKGVNKINHNLAQSFKTYKSPMEIYISGNLLFITFKDLQIFSPFLFFQSKKSTAQLLNFINQINKIQ